MNMFARFDEITKMTLQDIKETKRYRLMDNVRTVYHPTNTVCRESLHGYKKALHYSCIKLRNQNLPVMIQHRM